MMAVVAVIALALIIVGAFVFSAVIAAGRKTPGRPGGSGSGGSGPEMM